MSITDGSYVCGLCGEWRTACSLCHGAPLIRVRDTFQEDRAAERELDQQSRAIRDAAAKRQGW